MPSQKEMEMATATEKCEKCGSSAGPLVPSRYAEPLSDVATNWMCVDGLACETRRAVNAKADKAADARPGIATLTRDLRFVTFRYKAAKASEGSESLQNSYFESSHSVTVQIDLGAVMAYLGRKAAFSPKRRTSALDGAIVVTSIRRSEEREIRPHAGAIEPVTTAGPCYCQDCEAARKAKAVRS